MLLACFTSTSGHAIVSVYLLLHEAFKHVFYFGLKSKIPSDSLWNETTIKRIENIWWEKTWFCSYVVIILRLITSYRNLRIFLHWFESTGVVDTWNVLQSKFYYSILKSYYLKPKFTQQQRKNSNRNCYWFNCWTLYKTTFKTNDIVDVLISDLIIKWMKYFVSWWVVRAVLVVFI